MSKLMLIIVGIVIAILGVLSLFSAIMTVPMWLTIILLLVGVLSIVLGLMAKRN